MTWLQIYLEMRGWGAYCKGVNLEEEITVALSAMSEGEKVAAAPRTEPYRHPLFKQLMARLSVQLSEKIESSLMNGELFGGLKFLIIAAECAVLGDIGMPNNLSLLREKIEARIIPGGDFEKAFRRAVEILPKALFEKNQLLLFSQAPAPDDVHMPEVRTPDLRTEVSMSPDGAINRFPNHYMSVIKDPSRIEAVPAWFFIRYVMQARNRKDWDNVVLLQRALIAKNTRPGSEAYFVLAYALAKKGDIAEAKEIYQERFSSMQIENLDPRNARKLLDLKILLGEKVELPSIPVLDQPDAPPAPESVAWIPPETYKEVFEKERNFEVRLMKTHFEMLERYAMQAREALDYEPLKILGKIMLRRRQDSLQARDYLACAFEALGETDDALSVSATISQMSPKNDHQRRIFFENRARMRRLTGKNSDKRLLPKEGSAQRQRKREEDALPETNREESLVDEEKSNIDFSSFKNFVDSLEREAQGWQDDAKGEGWKKVSSSDRRRVLEYLTALNFDNLQQFPKSAHKEAFLQSASHLEKQISGSSVRLEVIAKLQTRYEKVLETE